jgi:hypothetical protein
MKDIAAKRTSMINQQHASKLIELGLVEMRDGILYLTVAGQYAYDEDRLIDACARARRAL